jgi:ERCC4-type nuclease
MAEVNPEGGEVFPYAVLVDCREKSPYSFAGLRTDADRPLGVLTRTVRLATGDYSLATMQDVVAVERKEMSDYFRSIGAARNRFVRELKRLNAMKAAAVVVEATWDTIMALPPDASRLLPRAVYAVTQDLRRRFPNVAWSFVDGRREGELTTFRFLEGFTRKHL